MATLEEFTDQARTDIEAKKTANGGDGMYKTVNNVRMEFTEEDYEQAIKDNAWQNYEDQEFSYIDARRNAYATIEDQLDMQYKDQINGTTTWKDHIEQVKSDNPKPGE